IEDKKKGHKPAKVAEPDDTNVVDLMSALRASLGASVFKYIERGAGRIHHQRVFLQRIELQQIARHTVGRSLELVARQAHARNSQYHPCPRRGVVRGNVRRGRLGAGNRQRESDNETRM
ncbi:MAG: hypothetical protein ACREKL_16765, partial [Chthoniobacterales bacterium]